MTKEPMDGGALRGEGVRLTPEQEKSRRQRNVAIALAIGAFVVLFYVVTIVKLGPAALPRPM